MTNSQSVLLVGDNFAHFGEQEGAITVSRLAELLDEPKADEHLPARVLIGQGVSESWLSYLQSRSEARSLDIEFLGGLSVNRRTGRRFAHKRLRKNILITDPIQLGINRYECRLAMDDDCELMSDHATGHHLQGMVLVEAARQTFLAVTEWFLLESGEKHYFAINRMDAVYRQFAFPIATDIQFDVSEIDRGRSDRVSVKASVKFMQLGKCVTEVEVDYTAILESRLVEREARMSHDALQRSLVAMQVDAILQHGESVPS